MGFLVTFLISAMGDTALGHCTSTLYQNIAPVDNIGVLQSAGNVCKLFKIPLEVVDQDLKYSRRHYLNIEVPIE